MITGGFVRGNSVWAVEAADLMAGREIRYFGVVFLQPFSLRFKNFRIRFRIIETAFPLADAVWFGRQPCAITVLDAA